MTQRVNDSSWLDQLPPRLRQWYQGMTAEGWVLGLSLFVVTYHAHDQSELGAVLLPVFLALGLVWNRALRSPFLWGAVSVTLLYGVVTDWALADNHQWLFALWSLTITLVYTVAAPQERWALLRANARWMIVLVMLLAVVQKALVPAYVDGSFFTYQALTDERFWPLTHVVTDIPYSDLAANRTSMRELLSDPTQETVTLTTNAAVVTLGLFMTWWVWGIELIIGLCLLLANRLVRLVGHAVNVYFIFFTYTFAPVFGFGSLLVVLGLVLTHREFPRLFWWYAAAFLYLLLLDLPWQTALPGWW